ncbi:MoxR family ATPase [Methanonatronarchaeum sp. AMET-Sl]|uniref:ATP-binding protein n=1 Tax=Methanonatronarchaeum sp. AMET-Sl TaxID=3037654 RepID=UPI00244DE948|nr:MoxR family ATPase [Methanonatronarchaeum sp. AMET-Sl]WGI17691.1 MoxR family ATPase [Methanonatronarchaeum sp. AMET-Sl]
MLASKTIGEAKETLRRIVSYSLETGEPAPPTFLWGGPGIGKSAIIQQIVDELGMSVEDNFIDLRLTQLDPVDLRGLPRLDSDEFVRWSTPHFLPQGGEGVLFLDELNLAPGAVQNAAYQLILDRELGSYKLPERWVIISAGNRPEDRAGVNPMKSPLSNRFIHWEVETDIEDWKDWAYKNNIDKQVIGFLNFKPEMLYQFNPGESEHAFPTPRTWERVSELLEIGFTETNDIASAIGLEAAREFQSYISMRNELPDPQEILEGKDIVPERPDILHVIVTTLIEKARHQQGYEERLIEYAEKLPTEFTILLIKDALRAGIPLQKTQKFTEFTQKHKETIIDTQP